MTDSEQSRHSSPSNVKRCNTRGINGQQKGKEKKKKKKEKKKDSHDEICAAVQLDKRMRASSSLAIAVNITVNEWSNLHRETPVQQAPVKC